jgi:DNA-binding response OmpR family regulator
MLIAVVSRNPEIIASVRSIAGMDADIQIVESRRASDLIRHMTTRAAIDLVIVDAEREFESAEIIASWRACHSRMDFAVMLVGRMVGWRNMARAFESGVDDIVVGNLQLDELYIRSMRCIARSQRHRTAQRSMHQLGAYRLDPQTQCIAGPDVSVQLTGQEFALASLFFSKPGVLFSRERIAATIWGRAGHDCDRTLEQAVSRLRTKLQRLPDSGLQIKAVYAQGYKLAVSLKPELTEEPCRAAADWPVARPSGRGGKARCAKRPLLSDVLRCSAKGHEFALRPSRSAAAAGGVDSVAARIASA